MVSVQSVKNLGVLNPVSTPAHKSIGLHADAHFFSRVCSRCALIFFQPHISAIFRRPLRLHSRRFSLTDNCVWAGFFILFFQKSNLCWHQQFPALYAFEPARSLPHTMAHTAQLLERAFTFVTVMDSKTAIASLPGCSVRCGDGGCDEFLREYIPDARRCGDFHVRAWFHDAASVKITKRRIAKGLARASYDFVDIPEDKMLAKDEEEVAALHGLLPPRGCAPDCACYNHLRLVEAWVVYTCDKRCGNKPRFLRYITQSGRQFSITVDIMRAEDGGDDIKLLTSSYAYGAFELAPPLPIFNPYGVPTTAVVGSSGRKERTIAMAPKATLWCIGFPSVLKPCRNDTCAALFVSMMCKCRTARCALFRSPFLPRVCVCVIVCT